MSSVSGFDGFAKALEARSDIVQVSISNVDLPFINLIETSRIIRKRLFFFNSISSNTEKSVSPFWKPVNKHFSNKILNYLVTGDQNTIVLLTALEDQFDPRFFTLPDELKKRIIVVAHQPTAWYRLYWRDLSALDNLGGIICLDSNQREFFSQVTKSPTIELRHGVNLSFFSPKTSDLESTNKTLLFVGEWLRDFDTLAHAMKKIWEREPAIDLAVVLKMQARSHQSLYDLARDSRVRFYENLNEEALLSLYQKSSLLFLPLKDSVANNAIVEGLAVGIPIITSKIGGTGDYIPTMAGERCPQGDAQAHADSVLKWIENSELRKKASQIGRKFAEDHLDWAKISNNFLDQLEKLNL